MTKPAEDRVVGKFNPAGRLLIVEQKSKVFRDYSKATGQHRLEPQRCGSELSQNAGSEEAERHGTRFSALVLGILSTQSRIGPGCLATVSLSHTDRNHRTEISSHELFFKEVRETRLPCYSLRKIGRSSP